MRAIRTALLVLSLSLFAQPSVANDRGCTELWAAGVRLFGKSAFDTGSWLSAIREGNGGACTITGFFADAIPGLRVRARQIEWSGQGLEGFVSGTALPTQLRIRVSGYRMEVRPTGDPKGRFLWMLQQGRAQPPTNVEIHWSHDPATGATRLTSTETGREEEPSVWFDGTLAAGGAAVVRGESVLYLGRAAERLVHLVLIGPTLRGRTREEAEALVREGFKSLVADLPGDAVDDASRAALESALAAWPNLRGRLEIGLEAPEGVTAGQLAALFLPWLPIPETQTEVRIRHVR